MPSVLHDAIVDLFHKRADLAVELLHRCADIQLDHARVELGSTDFGQVAPTSYRADAVVIVRGVDRTPITGVIVEVQRRVDRRKLASWPLYVTNLRAAIGGSAILLVIALTRSVARWASRAIETGHPGFVLTPLVIGAENLPKIRDKAAASQSPGLAVLSALAHPELKIAKSAIAAVRPLPEDQSRLYENLILNALPEKIRQTLERQMKFRDYVGDRERDVYSRGEKAGLKQGREAGLEQGRLQAPSSTRRSHDSPFFIIRLL